MSDLAFHIRSFVPDCQGAELEQRTALLVARDFAADLLSKVQTERAYDFASEAHVTAGTFVFGEASADRLKVVVAYVRNLVHAAFLAEQLSSEGGL